MKEIKVLLLLLFVIPVQAQFRLSGRVEGLKDPVIKIQVPFVYNFFARELVVPVKEDGRFDIRFPLDKEKLIRVSYDQQAALFYARPGQSLQLSNNIAGGRVQPAGGSLFKENKVLFATDPMEYPGFLTTPPPRDSLTNKAPDEIYTTYIRPWMQHVGEKTAAIEKTPLSPRLKKLFIQEARSAAYCRASEFARDIMKMDQLRVFFRLLYQPVSPKSGIDHPGPFYYWFVNDYIGYLESEAMGHMKASGNKTTEPLRYYNISLDSGTVMIRKIGKSYINWLAVKNTNSADVAEAYLAQQVFTMATEKDLKYAGALLEVLKKNYPASVYYPSLKNSVKELELLLEQNQRNSAIRIVANYDTVSSIYAVIDSLKGKVVYLDVWGTWCTPCKHELKFTPQLKQQFKDKDVAFVYLDVDENERDAAWKTFIKVNALTGLHLRKTRQQMDALWKELLANAEDKSEYYPQYFIFDKTGKLAVTKAERPSKKEALYKQIESVLNQ
ncbi:TlpA family protein disulfide reductase [Niabella drilacis]|uniref:Thiol-disulfide isomerase or thioredoxin n=1 Tax=Niabella drilacis (strain DSM 25811 / CCM 8410 / CCUG 62505 / LMG 26954 / E90) TaxID=1285928 RepID=A0A1G6XVK5_NIADE|nr:TlpA disulfide reductase family protein [Niabella drilacis]SDD81703.1 Thiol-disulfide isomerase or thioredoxin [Niabella drilacis]